MKIESEANFHMLPPLPASTHSSNSIHLEDIHLKAKIEQSQFFSTSILSSNIFNQLKRKVKLISIWGDGQKNLHKGIHTQTTISFNQGIDVIQHLQTIRHKTLKNFVLKFDGLCELICNKILKGNLLGNGESVNYLRRKINVSTLNKEPIKKSHLLQIYSIFERMIAFLFGIYPDNVFSIFEQWNLTIKTLKGIEINRELLQGGLQKVEIGATLKVEVFKRANFSFIGHSLLVKKVKENEFIFFDPNSGEHRKLNFNALCDKIDIQLAQHEATDICFLSGKIYLKRLQKIDNSSK